MSNTPGRDLTRYLTRYPEEIAFGDEAPAIVFDRYHVPEFVLYNDGLPLDREKLLAHVRPARKNATQIDVRVQDALTCGDQVAARYTLTARMRQGHSVATDIHMFGTLAPDGRLIRVDQLTRNVPTSEPDDR